MSLKTVRMSLRTSSLIPSRAPVLLAALASVLSVAVMLGAFESPAQAYTGKPKARTDKVSVMAGAKSVVTVLRNDKVAGKAKVRVTAAPKPDVMTVSSRKQRVVVQTRPTTEPGRYTAAYVVTDTKGRKARARVVITVTARGITPTPTPTPTATPTVIVTPTPTPTATPTVTPAADSLVAVINSLRVAAEVTSGYDRNTWKHWNTGLFSDGCDTRAEVLRSEAVVPVAAGTACPYTTSRSGGGQWYSYYDGVTTTDPSSYDIDHMVPLAEAHASGGNAWTAAQKETYANDQGDPRSLVAVTANSNRSKSDQDPGEWWPLLERCRYAAEWTATKARFGLSIDQTEKDALLLQASQCGDLTVTYTKAW